MRLDYDREADALAIHLSEGRSDRTIEVEPGTLVDVDRTGRALLIEIVHPDRPWPLDRVLSLSTISPGDVAMLRGMRPGPTIELERVGPLAVA